MLTTDCFFSVIATPGNQLGWYVSDSVPII